MNQKYYYNFFDLQRKCELEGLETLLNHIKDRSCGKIVGIYLEKRRDGLYTNSNPFKIFKLKDIELEYPVYFHNATCNYRFLFIDENNISYPVGNPLNFLNINDILEDLNRKKPEVQFEIEAKEEREFHYSSKFKRTLMKILFRKPKTYTAIINKAINVNLSSITYLKSDDGDDKLEVTDNKGIKYIVNNPYKISTIYKCPVDPFGEEDWDDEDEDKMPKKIRHEFHEVDY
jgi:hypothetical protein